MKNNRILFNLLSALLLLICNACSSSDNNDDPKKTNESLLTEMGILNPVTKVIVNNNQGDEPTITQFIYTDNKLTYVENENFSGTISYNPLSFKVQDNDGTTWNLINYDLNKSGYITNMEIKYYYDNQCIFTERLNNEYDNEGHMTSSNDVLEYSDGTTSDFLSAITWDNGNITKIESYDSETQNKKNITNFSYDKEEQKDNGTFYIESSELYNIDNMGGALCYSGLMGKPSKSVPILKSVGFEMDGTVDNYPNKTTEYSCTYYNKLVQTINQKRTEDNLYEEYFTFGYGNIFSRSNSVENHEKKYRSNNKRYAHTIFKSINISDYLFSNKNIY